MYSNAPPGTVRQAEEREAHGRREPFNVRFWGIGNESWGCGGHFKPQEYAAEYRRYVAQLPRYGDLYLIAAGPSGGDLNWTRGFFEAMPRGLIEGRRASLHGWALHYYTHVRGAATQAAEFNRQEWYGVLEAGARMERLIADHWKLMGEFDKNHRVKLVVDEWGTWYPAGTEIGPRYLFSQTITLRDALHSALTLDIFQRHADKVSMANIAQTINCIASLFLAEGDRYVRTPMFHVFEMYLPHQGGRLIPAAVQAREIEFAGAGGAQKLFGLAGSASLKEDRVTLTLVNPSLDGPLELGIQLAGATAREARATVLTHADMRATNTFAAPDQVAPKPLPVNVSGSGARLRLPGQSVAALEFRIG
jgi:alpha-N-arabinofuranosidase